MQKLMFVAYGVHLVVFPFWAGYFLVTNKSQLYRHDIKRKYESLYYGLKVHKYSSLLYPMIYLLRRALFVLVATTLKDYPFL